MVDTGVPSATKDALFSMFGVQHQSSPVWHEFPTLNAFEDNQNMLSKGLLWCAYYGKKKKERQKDAEKLSLYRKMREKKLEEWVVKNLCT